ncbi:MAG: sulfatase-like hydrolase/transferase [Gemmatimonadales bacterium]
MANARPARDRNPAIPMALAIVVMVVGLRAAAAPARPATNAAGALIDFGVLVGASLLAPRSSLGRGALWLLTLGYGTLVFWHGYFLEIADGFQLSPASLSVGTVEFFARELVSSKGWAVFVAFWVIAHLVSWWSHGSAAAFAPWRRPGRRVPAALLALGLGVAAVPGVDHPLAALVRDLARLAIRGTIEDPTLAESVEHLDRRAPNVGSVASRFDRVLLFVMEGVTREELDSLRPLLPEHGFFRRAEREAVQYRGYYTVDQESRTARMAMIHSLMVPYEAYLAGWEERFAPVFAPGGLVRLLGGNGWRTAVAIPLREMPWDLRALPFDTTLRATAEDFARSGVTCLAPTPFDEGCEDAVLLDRVGGLLAAPGRLFLFQPFLFGHTSRWEEVLRTHRVRYYDRYLARVLDALERDSLGQSTLVVATSDHGPRTARSLRRPASYELPLWLVHPSFAAETRTGFFGSPDLRDLLLATMATGEAAPAPRRAYLMAMGPTARGSFVCLYPGGGLIQVALRGDGVGAVSHAAPADSARTRSCVATFFHYRRRFDALR